MVVHHDVKGNMDGIVVHHDVNRKRRVVVHHIMVNMEWWCTMI